MSPYFKAVRSIIRLVASGLIIIGLLLAGLELLNHRAKGVEVNGAKVLFQAVLMLAGAGLFIGGGKLAARLTDENDESDEPDDPPQNPDE